MEVKCQRKSTLQLGLTRAVSMQIEHLKREIERLSDEDFERLRRWFAEKDRQRSGQQLEFGAFGGDEAAMSTMKNFALGEWQPSDEELDGS